MEINGAGQYVNVRKKLELKQKSFLYTTSVQYLEIYFPPGS
jgi:hypothetical protein